LGSEFSELLSASDSECLETFKVRNDLDPQRRIKV
jgi:hypothetical protein